MIPNPQYPGDLVTFTKEILNGKLHFLSCKRGKSKLSFTVFTLRIIGSPPPVLAASPPPPQFQEYFEPSFPPPTVYFDSLVY